MGGLDADFFYRAAPIVAAVVVGIALWQFRPGSGRSAAEEGRNGLGWILAAAGMGLVGILVFALQGDEWTTFASIASVAGLLAGASMSIGAVLGFIFAVPRAARQPVVDEATVAAARGPAQTEALRYAPNTNLEEISDWLTKILVGVGLVQFGEFAGALEDATEALAPALGGLPGSEVFALLVMVHFATCGFLQGYFWTSVYLPNMLEWGQNRAGMVAPRHIPKGDDGDGQGDGEEAAAPAPPASPHGDERAEPPVDIRPVR